MQRLRPANAKGRTHDPNHTAAVQHADSIVLNLACGSMVRSSIRNFMGERLRFLAVLVAHRFASIAILRAVTTD